MTTRHASQRIGAALLAVALLAGACAPTAAPGGTATGTPQGGVQKGGTLVVAVRETVLSLDPANHRSRVTETVIRSMFDGLVTRTPDGKVVAEIAEKWAQTAPTTWDFTIRDGVTFHDGSKLTAEDVRFTLHRVAIANAMDGKTSPRQSLLPKIKAISAPDARTVRIELESATPGAILLAGLVHQQIVPKAYVEKVGGAGLAEKPIGAGPFKFVEAKLDQQVVVARYDGYYGGSPEMTPVAPANVDRVIFRVSPELSTAVSALKTGEVNVVQSVPAASVRELRADPNVQIKSYDGTRTTWVALNVTKAPLNDARVRRALNHAVNVAEIVAKVYEGEAVQMSGAVPAFSQFVDTSIKPYGFDQAKAKALLAEAGKTNFPLVIDCIASFKDVGEVIAQQLRAVGVDASVRIWESATLQAAALAGERQAVLWDWGNAFRHPVDLLDAVLKTKARGNYANYGNPEVDRLLDQGSSATDERTAQEAYFKAQRILYDEAPWIFGWVPKEIEAATKNVQNWQPGPDGRELLADVWLNSR
ncbi:MAG: ABC transporter substrate-binding protein [Candidatus Limnocylindria bacterium]